MWIYENFVNFKNPIFRNLKNRNILNLNLWSHILNNLGRRPKIQPKKAPEAPGRPQVACAWVPRKSGIFRTFEICPTTNKTINGKLQWKIFNKHISMKLPHIYRSTTKSARISTKKPTFSSPKISTPPQNVKISPPEIFKAIL